MANESSTLVAATGRVRRFNAGSVQNAFIATCCGGATLNFPEADYFLQADLRDFIGVFEITRSCLFCSAINR